MTEPQLKTSTRPREFQFGNTTVIIHSKLAWMSPEEQRTWFREQWELGNPVLRQIADAVFDI